MVLAVLTSLALAVAAQAGPASPTEAPAASPAPEEGTSLPAVTKTPEELMCENIALWQREIVFQMALTVAVGVQAAPGPRQTATTALSDAQKSLLDNVQAVHTAACR